MSDTVSEIENEGEPGTFTPKQMALLRAQVAGSALVPRDEGYDKARQTWDAKTFDQHPALVVLPATTADVQVAVHFAREHGLPIAVQGGGHGHPYPADGALLVNFMNMTRVHVSPETATARVEPGVLFSALVDAAHSEDLAPLNGFAASVGVVGYMLGGGAGWLTRQYGSAAASIRSLELVTADGNVLRVDAASNPELLWGLRGGGGNFGIVVALECALYPVKEVFAGQVAYPLAQGNEVLAAYFEWTKTVPDELTSALRIMTFPPADDVPPALRGKSAVVIMACYNGDTKSGEALVAPVRSLGKALHDTFALIPYSQVATIARDPDVAPPLYLYNESGACGALTAANRETLLRAADDATLGISMVEIRQLGGALARQLEDTTAFNWRGADFYLDLQALAPSPALLAKGKAAISALMQALQPALTGQTLINFQDAGNVGNELTRAAYSRESYARLEALKDKYDPKNVFRFNHNIPPATA